MIYATEQQVVVTSAAIITVALVALFVGIIWGRRRGLEDAAEELQWAQEEARTCREALERHLQPPEVAHEAWEDQALTLANEAEAWSAPQGPLLEAEPVPILEPTVVISPGEESITAWTRRMAEDMDRFLKGLIGRTDEQLREITR